MINFSSQPDIWIYEFHAPFPRYIPTQESNPGSKLQFNGHTKTTGEIVSMIFSYVETTNEYNNFGIDLVHDRCKRLPNNHAKCSIYDKNNYGKLEESSAIVV
jgi:hypothetical protein